MRCEVDNALATFETWLPNVLLVAKASLVLGRVELNVKSVNVSSGDPGSFALDPDHWYFSGIVGGLQMTASSRVNSNTSLNRIDGNCDNITIKTGDLSFMKRSFDCQTHAYHDTFNFFRRVQEKITIHLIFAFPQLFGSLRRVGLSWNMC